MNLDRLLGVCLGLLARGKAKGWRGTGLGFHRSRGALSFGAGLFGGRFYAAAGFESTPGAGLERQLRARGYRGASRGRGYWKRLPSVASIDRDWAALSESPAEKVRDASLDFHGLARWFRRARLSGWSVSGAEFRLARMESAYGHRWSTRRDLMLDQHGLHAAFFAWPARPFRGPDRKRLESLGFYRRADKDLAQHGLIGRWGPMSAARPNEWSADHWKRGVRLRELPRLWKSLTDLRLPALP